MAASHFSSIADQEATSGHLSSGFAAAEAVWCTLCCGCLQGREMRRPTT